MGALRLWRDLGLSPRVFDGEYQVTDDFAVDLDDERLARLAASSKLVRYSSNVAGARVSQRLTLPSWRIRQVASRVVSGRGS